MKTGISTYCLLNALNSGEMTVLDIIDWIAENGGELMEMVPYGFTLIDQPDLADSVREKAEACGIELANYSMPANFVQETRELFEEEVRRVCGHVDLLRRLGMKHMRHDVTAFRLPPEQTGIDYFEQSLPLIVEGSRRVADYAATFGITTTIENHGVCVQSSDRVQRVLQAVDRSNFRTTLDIGNFLCVDEQPLVGVRKNLPYASLIHIKDFYIRPHDENPGGGPWFRSTGGAYLRGAIVGQGDLEMRRILKLIKDGGYDGRFIIEFEGMEECREATAVALANFRRLWAEA